MSQVAKFEEELAKLGGMSAQTPCEKLMSKLSRIRHRLARHVAGTFVKEPESKVCQSAITSIAFRRNAHRRQLSGSPGRRPMGYVHI